MSTRSEQDVAGSFVSLATALATGADVVELLAELTEDCARLLDVDSAGLLLADGSGVLHVLAATSADTRELEVFQTQRVEGPCLDCYRSGEVLRVPDLEGQAQRWPAFAAVALGMGFSSVHAVPMRLRARRLGALGLFGRRSGALDDSDLSLGQALADVASVAIVQNSSAPAPAEDDAVLESHLQDALRARVVVEQAKGVLAYSGSISMAQAHAQLRGYARDHGLRLSDLAAGVVERRTPVRSVLEHRSSTADLP
ncbi:GAF and ANTAR domain-containing protein [Quadrisphaera setariae]|uniref:GAF and ANTAR domain-containing protein n=1 Tax=Quadrisphaera setariae TaxID=2593304 RepID=A0A5C8ZFY3_9ACTN|nr:GAF and ANTAR domain-containing protein [Quadrisphaera setariae]TXR56113.1 GAF and ANTAR domain-containing protein [Quadrisphaera setariae]